MVTLVGVLGLILFLTSESGKDMIAQIQKDGNNIGQWTTNFFAQFGKTQTGMAGPGLFLVAASTVIGAILTVVQVVKVLKFHTTYKDDKYKGFLFGFIPLFFVMTFLFMLVISIVASKSKIESESNTKA
jgi:hypothetical protein